MPQDLEVWVAFRRHETATVPPLTCCECGKPAQGNAAFDGGGEICDGCVAESERLLATVV